MAKAKKAARFKRRILRAHEFHLVDVRGQIRGIISSDDTSDGTDTSIQLYDSQNRARVHVSVRADGTPHIGLLRENGSAALGIGINAFLGTGLAILDTEGKQILTFDVSPNGELHYPCQCNRSV